MRRLITASLVSLVVLGFIGTPVASAQQQLVLSVGGFSPKSEDSRNSGDVLAADRQFLDFNIGDLSGPAVNGEWLVNLGNNFEAGLGVGFYQRTAPAVDALSTFANGDPVIADLKLRVIPFSATVRWLPMGHHNGVEPYLGAGVGVFNYRYSETGDFVSNDNVTIIHGSFVGSGTATGPVILGGVRVPVGTFGIGGELRYQAATGDLPGDQGFAGPKIDLGGLTFSFTINVKF